MSNEEDDVFSDTGENVKPSDVFAHQVGNLISDEDISKIISSQRQMLCRYEKTNEMLITVTDLASQRYQVLNSEFRNHTSALLEMKKDLDSTFRRISNLKSVISKHYPREYQIALSTSSKILEEDEDDEVNNTSNLSFHDVNTQNRDNT